MICRKARQAGSFPHTPETAPASAQQWRDLKTRQAAHRHRKNRSSDTKSRRQLSADSGQNTYHTQSRPQSGLPPGGQTQPALHRKSPHLPHHRHQVRYLKHHPQTVWSERPFLHRLSQRKARGIRKMPEGQCSREHEVPVLKMRHATHHRSVRHSPPYFRHA